MPAPGAAADDAVRPGVLILHSNQRPTPSQIIVDDTLRSVVSDGFRRPVDLFSEYLDDERAFLQVHGAIQAEFLAEVCAGPTSANRYWHV